MANKKTTKDRIIHAFLPGEALTKSDLRRKLRIPRTELNDYWFDNTYMRTVRALEQDNVLLRITRGKYVAFENRLYKLFKKRVKTA